MNLRSMSWSLAAMFLPASVPAQESGPILLQESFEATAVQDGLTYTQPEVFPAGAASGGQIVGSAALVPGRVGRALRLQGFSQVRYPAGGGLVDLAGGQLSFWVALDFDPAEKNERTRTVLRNQLFVTFLGPERSRVCVYTCLTDLCLGVQNEAGNLILSRTCLFEWRPGEWHQITLRWGQEMQLWCDGEPKFAVPWDGLFGPVPVPAEAVVLVVGSLLGWSDVESEFTLDELVIRGPAPDQISARPRLTLPLLKDEPVLDGSLSDPFWQRAARVTGFTRFDRPELASLQPAVYAAYTEKGLYFALEAPLPEGRSPQALLTERDAPLYSGEDSLEIFLQPSPPDGPFFQFIANALGARFDSRTEEGQADIGGYNPEWEVKASGRPGQWTAEIFVPFQALGLEGPPPPGQVWKGNFCLDSPAGFSSAATWSFTNGNFTRPVFFGEWLLAGSERTLRTERFGGFESGEPALALQLVGDFQPIVTVQGQLLDSSGQRLFQHQLPLRDAKAAEIKPPPLTTGHYTLTVSAADERGQALFHQRLSFETARALNLTVANYPYAGYLQLTADVRGLKQPLQQVVCDLTAAEGQPLGTVELKDFPGGVGQARWPNEDLPPGHYTVEARALSPEGQVLETARQHFQIFPRPPWWKNDLGLDHSVPPPFTPVQEQDGTISVWGRDLNCGSGAFPQQITSQGAPLFTRPPTLLLRTGGQEVDLARLPRQGREAFPDWVSFTGNGRVGDVAVSLRSTVEFDGCIRCDLTLTPAQATAIEELTLTLPLPPERVQFLQASSGASGNVLAFDREFSSSFLPYLWLGNDDGGLAFFAESDQFWTPHDQKMLQVISHPHETVLQAHFIATGRTLTAPLTFTFGLMATPIRPIPPNDPYAYPSYDYKGSIAFPEFLTYPIQDSALAAQGTLEFWCRRSQPQAPANTELFHLVGKEKSLHAYLLTPDAPDLLTLLVDRQPLLEARVPLETTSFAHLAVVWDAETLAIYWQGQRVGQTDSAAFREALGEGIQQLRFGCQSEWQGYTGLLLDEVRLSRCVRYRGESVSLPSAPFEPDADTVLLDPLEESFRPDGQDAHTRGGGTPSIGAVFEAGRFGRGLKLEVAPPRPALEVMKELGIRVVSHWEWQEPMQRYYAQPVLFGETVPGLQEEVAEYHRYGIPIIPYAAYPAVGGPSPLVEQFGEEWGLRPVSTLPWQFPGAPEGYHLYNCCLQARGFADYLVGGAAWAMDSFGFDGIYTDGLAHVYACQNQAHGCGYLDEEGHLHSTWPIFATREALKRLYRVIKSRKPEGFLVNHASFNYLMPTLSFSDILYTGEHEDYENLLNARVRFNSKPWGLYVTTLGSSEHIYSPLHTMTSLLHGVSVWGSGLLGRNDFGRKEARIWQAYRAFDTITAEWVPYFQGENRYYQVSEPNVKASLYFHPGRNVLLVVGNYHREAQEVHLRLDLARLGLAGKALAGTNVLTEVAVPVSAAGEIRLQIPAKSFVLLRLEGR